MIAAKFSAHQALNFSNFIAQSSLNNPAIHTAKFNVSNAMIII
jgi:hypothetical protein